MVKKEYGFVRIATAIPKLKVGDVSFNITQIKTLIDEAHKKKSALLVFPELSITGYTVGDLFHNAELHTQIDRGITQIVQHTKNKKMTVVVGAPLLISQKLFNVAVVISNGVIAGIVPKSNIPEYKEFYEKRWFSSGESLCDGQMCVCAGAEVPVGTKMLFSSTDSQEVIVGVEICEDLWLPIPPSSYQTLAGATIVANLSASNELVGKAEYRRKLVESQSARTIATYAYTSSGVHESTTDVVFSGHSIIASNGRICAESKRFFRDNQLVVTDVDVKNCITDRMKTTSFGDMVREVASRPFRHVPVEIPLLDRVPAVECSFLKNPFLPNDERIRGETVKEVFEIQVAGLVKRLEYTGIKKIVLGLSGGLDSTLAFLVAIKALDTLRIPRANLHAITMPGFGTTKRTKTNAVVLAESAGASLEEVSIVPGATQQLRDIRHNNTNDITYENVQARYRTMILMNKANQIGGLVLGTGDLSEAALGWCTFNGDHISNYNVNASVPKTLVRYIIESVAGEIEQNIASILKDIVNTPISPELVGNSKKQIVQKTESIIGPYILHDFFLYHFVRWNSSPQKIMFLAEQVFRGVYTKREIKKWLTLFIHRFFKNQWKRSVASDGPKVGSVSLSPRGDWRMPSDAEVTLWIESIR